MGEMQRIVVVVEEEEAAKTALQWALHNLLRLGDVIVLLHVFSPPPRRRKKNSPAALAAARLLRLRGYHLALSFRQICDDFFNVGFKLIEFKSMGSETNDSVDLSPFLQTNTEIIVREGDEDGKTIAEVVREIGASTLLVGLHQNSFLYRWAMRSCECKVLAVKQPSPEMSPAARSKGVRSPRGSPDSSTSFDFSQIEISGLQMPEIPTAKVPYKICPSPHAIIWRTRPSR
ncbi:PREDICTED: uncharacterized protein LOC104820410 isoform X1 [Tarenaya hassleriana]|uniref:uncharacterized protein LOC104820410 isoform X1 n=1 Tax=Tarenaya hassleriana TaxID=28532 RepID=UPI00053C710B|nr:PREDICTED: uncharacterized protein LOC104820410 isoform X1 [Tarenaya hassleriana]